MTDLTPTTAAPMTLVDAVAAGFRDALAHQAGGVHDAIVATAVWVNDQLNMADPTHDGPGFMEKVLDGCHRCKQGHYATR